MPNGRQPRANKVSFDVGLLEDTLEDRAEGSRIHAQSYVVSKVGGVLPNLSRFGPGACGDAGAIGGAGTSDDGGAVIFISAQRGNGKVGLKAILTIKWESECGENCGRGGRQLGVYFGGLRGLQEPVQPTKLDE